MKVKFTYLLLFIGFTLTIYSQTKPLLLSKSNGISFQGNVYTFGIRHAENGTRFQLYKLNSKTEILDSLQLVLHQSKTENYLQLTADTLHNFLNIYLQKENTKEVRILRVNKNIKLLADIEHVDIARLNNSALFDKDVLFFKTDVYTVKINSDSSGKQFYINKYHLKSNTENFDYSFVWQFPFERKNIHDAHLFYANDKEVMVFVHITEGIKKGQWVLKLNSTSGELLKATKLNSKNEATSLFFGIHLYDKSQRRMHLFGQEFSETQVDIEKSVYTIMNAPSVSIFHLELDTIGNLLNKESFQLPVQIISSGAKRTKHAVLLQFKHPSMDALGNLNFELDLYKSGIDSFCFLYTGSQDIILKKSDDAYQISKTTLSNNKLIEDYFFTSDKNDLNGKICVDSLKDIPSFFYTSAGFPTKIHFKLDSSQSACWLLNKHSFGKNNVNLSVLHPVNKLYKLESLFDVNESKTPVIIYHNEEKCIILHQSDETHVELNLFNW